MKVKIDNAFFEAMGHAPGVVALVDAKTKEIAEIVRKDMPVDTGAARDSVVATSKKQRRHVGLVQVTDPKWAIIESKTGVMARALRKSRSRG